jgi:hypothetical protein
MSRNGVRPDRVASAGWATIKLIDWVLFGIFAALIVLAATEIAPDVRLSLLLGK